MNKNNNNTTVVTSTEWKGYIRHDFIFASREGLVVFPKKAAKCRPWVWRSEFFDAFAQADMALLEQGWAIAYYKLNDMYGCPAAVELMNGFYTYVRSTYELAAKAALFGFSRGGLYAFNYAGSYPNHVMLMYLDAPVLDIRSWPGGKGVGNGAQAEWSQCLSVYGITEEESDKFQDSPLDRIENVLQANIPILIVAGDADEVVPFHENAAILEERYRQRGGAIMMIVKPGIGHHPHSLENPQPILDWMHMYYELYCR